MSGGANTANKLRCPHWSALAEEVWEHSKPGRDHSAAAQHSVTTARTLRLGDGDQAIEEAAVLRAALASCLPAEHNQAATATG